MADKKWWFNRVGEVAPISNPASPTPNYGLTYDIATAPVERDEFDDMAEGLAGLAAQTSAAYGGTPGQSDPTNVADFQYGNGETSWWDRAKGAAGWLGDQGSGVVGALEYTGADRVLNPLGSVVNDAQGLLSDEEQETPETWEDLKALGQDTIAGEAKDLAATPGAEQIFWGLEKANEYSSTVFVAATLSEDDMGDIFDKGLWGDAHELTNERHLNAGEAFTQMFYDKELILDEERFEQTRQHNTVFNVGALAFNVTAAWKLDPNVLVGKGIGASRNLAVGKLNASGRTAEVQRDILSQPDLETARAAAQGYSSLPDKLRAAHSVSLYDRSLQLRADASAMGFEEFKRLPAFRNSASGVTMAKLMQDVAHDDDAWNLVFRSAIGDPDAVGQLAARQGEVSDKISAIELKTMPLLERDLERVETRYKKRLAEQGRPQDARIEITRFGDRWLEDEATMLRADADDLNAKLATYTSHESWLQRALPGLDEDAGLIDRNSPNSIFGNLDRLGGDGAIRRSLPSLGGKVKTWQHDDYSPRSWVFRAPTKPFLKRVGVVSLNDVDDGASAITGYLDQLDYIQGGTRQGFRDEILSRYAGATTDMERKAAVEQLERNAITALGEKWNLSPALMDQLGKTLQSKRRQAWGRFSDRTIYSPIKESNFVEYADEAGNMVRIKTPVDPTQLANWHPLTNLTDLDRTIRQNLDSLRDIDEDLVGRVRSGVSMTERHITETVDALGSYFNSFWKPLALLSIRWPTRVVADESMRVMLLAGALPQLAHWSRGAGNAMYNTGVVRPFEWWNGRKVKTGSLAEESLRGVRSGYDAHDYRAITNPQAAAPADALDFGQLDTKRYDRLNKMTAERWQHLRSIDADRYRATTNPTPQPSWARAWDERLDGLESAPERGFFFDPARPHRGVTKGFAVSPYPGRMRTFPRKPTGRELNYWTEQNSDLLAIPNTRAAVWLDKDTGRWHLDVVKTTKRREDAMLLASKAEATEFYDIEDGFTRYLSEDFWGHFDSPFVKPREANPPGGALFDQAQVSDEAGAAIGDVGIGGPTKQKIGFGTKKWRTRDGRVVEGEDVFGADTKNANIYYSVVSSKEAIQNLYGGHTRGIGKDRAARQSSDYRTWDPEDPGTDLAEWAKAYSYFVNNHIRYSPLGQRMLEGQTDDEIYEWLMSTAKGRAARKRIGVRGENPHKWVSDVREIFDHLFPTERSLQAARVGEVDEKQVLDLIPEGMRPEVHGDTIKMGLGDHVQLKWAGAVVDKMMTYLGSVPTDAMVRHPFAATIYNREMRRYLSSVPADKVTNNVLAAAEASARAKAVREVRKTLYNIADEREGVHLLRFVSPFFQAQIEVLERYARISMEKPETVARIAQLLQGSQTLQTGLWQVQDREGNQAKGYSNENQVVFQVTPTLRGIVNKFPGLQGALDNAGDVTVPVASLNLILQGENPFLPSAGPVATLPASEFYYKDRPELEDEAVFKWLYPFGGPRGGGFGDRAFNTLAPAYMRRAKTVLTEDFDDSAFARRVSEIGAQQMIEWEQGGREGPRPTPDAALEAAKNEYKLRAASSFFMPAPATPRSPFQFWIDQYRSYKEKYGLDADEKFYDEYGPTYFMFAQQATEAAGGMGPNVGEKKAYDRYKDLAQRAPLMTGVLTGPFASTEFSDAVYQWQLTTRSSPDSTTMLRERNDPAERIADAEVSRGWVEYGKLASAIEAEVRNRVATGGSPYLTATANADLAAIKQAKIREIIDRNPAWNDAYNSRSADLGTWLDQAYDVSFDEKLDGRTDIEALRTYLISRARLQDALRQREDSGLASSDQFSYDPLGNPIGDNADLAMAWQSYVGELTARNPLFAEIYNRYLEGDDLSTYISPEVSGAAA